ncbi:MAG: dTDP-glucose 4,6-dehydratase [Roseburia sp.]|nr:dTDP-glucose 4,6-dehydratase [Anaeroplasma bactoclasticum]MCM1196281.1 dTDP-glucose 4,6-dehydratase [Roseburia sp.]MCM1557388.1 dTDP-glucose 4,6-dehydratase [Anaeroplasma bactoclasticum]
MSKFLITGGAGFIGGNFCNYMVNAYPEDMFICLDALTYAGNMKTISSLLDKTNFKFIKENICNKSLIFKIFEEENFDYVINFAAETHVDRSIENPSLFLETNVLGTQILLEACRKYGIKRFHQISTDEVYGDLPLNQPNLQFTEEAPLRPSSPYSASKAAADLLVLSYFRTYGIYSTISRSSNNYGPFQFPEKLIPLTIEKASLNETIPVYGTGTNIRDWLYVYDHCKAIDLIVRKGKVGAIYNVGGNNDKANLEVVKFILKELGKPENLITFVKDRKGHDLRYSLNCSKIKKELGWEPIWKFDIGLKKTIHWNLENLRDNKKNG